MSIQHVSAVLDCRAENLTGCRKLVLVTLANRTDAQGKCWPSQQLIADECGISVRALSDHLKGLEEDGFIVRTTKHLGKGNGSCTTYAINLEKLVVVPAIIAPAEVAPTEVAHAISVGCTGRRPRVTNLQEPSVTIEAKASIVVETEKQAAKKQDPKGCRLEDDWSLPHDWLLDAVSIAAKSRTPLSEMEICDEADRFRDFWHAKPGVAGRKTNWRATWRNWIRSHIDRRKHAPASRGAFSAGQHSGSSIADAAFRRALQRANGNGVPDQSGWRHDISPAPDIVVGEYRKVG